MHRCGTIALCAILLGYVVRQPCRAQQPRPPYEKLVGPNAVFGKEYWIANPPNETPGYPVVALEIYVTSVFDTEVDVFEANTGKPFTVTLEEGQTSYVTVELARNHLLTGKGDMFRVVASEPQTQFTCECFDKNDKKRIMRGGALLYKAGDEAPDPFMMNVTPLEQFSHRTTFQFPTQTAFSSHKLNLIVHANISSPNLIDNLKPSPSTTRPPI